MSGDTGTESQLAESLRTQINELLGKAETIDLIGTWEIVWGPAVQVVCNKQAANVMYVANREDQYVIAIAGTGSSQYDWIVENAYVTEKQEWPYRFYIENEDEDEENPENKKDPKISCATYIGLQNLKEMRSSDHDNKTLVEYLRQLTAEVMAPIEVITTGHSQGGSLSATLALDLLDTQQKEPENQESWDPWDPNRRATVCTYPSAGPTPGNAHFSEYFGKRFGTDNDRVKRVWNQLDIVPQLADVELSREILIKYLDYADTVSFRYRKTILLLEIIRALIKDYDVIQLLADLLKVNDYVQLPSNYDYKLEGAFEDRCNFLSNQEVENFIARLLSNSLLTHESKARSILQNLNQSNLENKNIVGTLLKDLDKIFKQITHQHTCAYIKSLDMEELYGPAFESVLSKFSSHCCLSETTISNEAAKRLKDVGELLSQVKQ